ERIGEDGWVCGQPEEPQHDGPGQTDRPLALDEILPPAARAFVLRRSLVVRVEEKVDVGQDHRPPRACGRTSRSSASWLSRRGSTPGRNALRNTGTRYGRRRASRDSGAERPRRSVSFTTWRSDVRRWAAM